MPKDNENIPFLGPVEPLEPQAFAADQMIRCEECLRANPPTRVNCLYCVAPLPLTESAARLRKPVLRPPEKHQLGYNNILLPPAHPLTAELLAEAAELLKMGADDLEKIISQQIPLPVARTASREEAELVFVRLKDLGLQCLALGDEELGFVNTTKRVKSMSFEETYFTVSQVGAIDERFTWTDIVLLLPARLFETRLEITERKTRKTENEILDTSEFSKDEAVIDFYTTSHSFTWRINSGGFDFSCLGKDKALIATENIRRLQRLLIEKAVNAQVDDSYNRVRNLLELAWPTQPDTQSSGWRRERPGKLSVGMATTKSNETQFTRYSRLSYYLSLHS